MGGYDEHKDFWIGYLARMTEKPVVRISASDEDDDECDDRRKEKYDEVLKAEGAGGTRNVLQDGDVEVECREEEHYFLQLYEGWASDSD